MGRQTESRASGTASSHVKTSPLPKSRSKNLEERGCWAGRGAFHLQASGESSEACFCGERLEGAFLWRLEKQGQSATIAQRQSFVSFL